MQAATYLFWQLKNDGTSYGAVISMDEKKHRDRPKEMLDNSEVFKYREFISIYAAPQMYIM